MSLVAAFLLAMLVMAGSGCGQPAGSAAPAQVQMQAQVQGDTVMLDPASPQLQALELEPARPRPAPDRTFTGRLVWDDDVTVRVYSPVAGRVLTIEREPGEVVAAGDVLMRVDSPDFGQVQTEVRKAQADLALATRNRERQRDLYAHGAAARQDFEGAEADYQRALSESERAQSVLALYGGRTGPVDDVFALKSPLAGVVAERNLTPGQQLRADQILASDPSQLQPLFVVTDPTRLWVLLDVPEVDLAAIQPGQDLTIHSRAYPDREFRGLIQLVGASLDPTTRTVKARGVVQNPDGALKAEMYVAIDVRPNDAAPSVTVPSNAVFLDGDQHYVFVELDPGRFRRTAVRLGRESDHVVAVDGLPSGGRVVTSGALLLEQIRTAESKG